MKSGSNLSCSKAKLWELNDGKRCTYNSSSKTIDCNSNEPAWGGNTYNVNAWNTTINSGTTNIYDWPTTINNWPTYIYGGDITITWGTTNIHSGATVTIISWSSNGGGSNWTKNGTTLYPNNTSTKVAIGTGTANNYTLNVNWSWRFANKLNVWDNFYILSDHTYKVYVPWSCSSRTANSPLIRYNWSLVFRDNDPLQCSNWYTEFGQDGRVGIGWPSTTDTKLSVYWHTRIYSTASATDQFIDLYTTNYWQSHIESKWSEMRVWLTWVIDWWWNPTYLYFKYWSIGVNKTPNANSPSPWTSNNATLQINWWIQISNNSTISNSSPSTNCESAQEWMIQYYSWNFYGCNGSVWKKFDMSSLQAWGTQISSEEEK